MQIYFEGHIAVYGAGTVAVSVYTAVRWLFKNCTVVYFIVTRKEGNPEAIDGIPVVSLDEFERTSGRDHMKIVVAVPENYHPDIRETLEKRGLREYFCVDSGSESILMEEYFKTADEFLPLSLFGPKRGKGAEYPWNLLTVYMVRFHRDRNLRSPCEYPPWICPIQAGAALTNMSIADIRDNTGDHISEKNGNYSELTALYWIWKNRGYVENGSDYLGLFHYRRILDMGETDLCRLREMGIDVILPYPTIHLPSIKEQHRRYVRESDWNAMISALEELEPEYAGAMPYIFSRPYFYNYNMFIARREIFCRFCGWLFPILLRTEELSVPRGWERADRYMGYLGENLTTLYFMYHKRDLKIAHTGRRMLV